MYLLYLPNKNVSIYSVNETTRQSTSIILGTPTQYSGEVAHGYLCAMSVDGKMIANSVYAGSIVI